MIQRSGQQPLGHNAAYRCALGPCAVLFLVCLRSLPTSSSFPPTIPDPSYLPFVPLGPTTCHEWTNTNVRPVSGDPSQNLPLEGSWHSFLPFLLSHCISKILACCLSPLTTQLGDLERAGLQRSSHKFDPLPLSPCPRNLPPWRGHRGIL